MEKMNAAELKKANGILEAACVGNLRNLKNLAKKLDKGNGIKATIALVHDDKGEGALHWAAREGKKEICQYLIENLGFDPDFRPFGVLKKEGAGDVKLYSEKTPLICAVFDGSLNTLEYLIDRGANLNARDENELTSLHTAVMQEQVESLRVLASKGAPIDPLHYSGTPLLLATARDDNVMVQILLDHKADPDMNYKEVMFGQFITPLVISVLNGSMKCTELLIKAGADVNKQPVLEMAICSKELLNYLLEFGANPNIPNTYGKLPIEVAAVRGEREAVEILFPLTSPIEAVKDWSVEGLFTHVESETFKKRERICSKVKIARLKQTIDNVMDREGYVTARYLCFYALQEDPQDEEILAKKALCRMRIEKDVFDAVLEIHESKSPQACRLLADILLSKGNQGAATLVLLGAMSLEPDNADHKDALLATGVARVKNRIVKTEGAEEKGAAESSAGRMEQEGETSGNNVPLKFKITLKNGPLPKGL
ncbi:hypothetical protein LUZ60_005324 [Juncus effusus]|nr:hypothetical protein LUZ60_005324 [Juncus effusus]